MRGMVLRHKQHLAVEDLPRPSPESGWVLLRVRACGICGSDLHMARFAEDLQRAAEAAGRRDQNGMDLDHGVVMGHEWVAEVVEAGPDGAQWTPGTRVTFLPAPTLPGLPRLRQGPGYNARYPGGYGEYMVVRSDRLQPVPAHVPDRVAATTEPCAVGLHAVREARLRRAESVLVMGAGPIGMMTLLWLKHDGVRYVTVSDPSAPRRALAVQCGADLVLDPAQDDIAARILDAAGDLPAVVFECVGVPGTLQQAMELVAPRGRVVVVGVCMNEDHMLPITAIGKHLTLQFVLEYTVAEVVETLAAFASGRIDPSPVVTRTVSLDDLPSAFQALSDPADCKVLVAYP